MTNTALMSSVRAFAPTNFLGAPRVAYSPGEGDATAPQDDTPLSLADAANAYANVSDEEPDEGQPNADDDGDGANADEELPSDDEADGEDEEGDPDDEGQANDDEGDEPESEQGRFVSLNGKVTLPDGSVATVADLVQGNLRDRDYRQKTMELAENRKAIQTQSDAFKQQEQEIGTQRDMMVTLLKSIVPPPPDPNMLQTDPMGYMTQKANHDAWVAHLTDLEAQQQQATTASQARSAEDRKQKIDAEWKALVGKAPDLEDKKKLDGFVADLGKFGVTYGFSVDEIKSRLPSDHRLALVMRDAIRWQKFQANKGKTLPKKDAITRPPVNRGGQRLDPQRTQARAGRAAMERLNTSGSLKDGIAALLATEGKG